MFVLDDNARISFTRDVKLQDPAGNVASVKVTFAELDQGEMDECTSSGDADREVLRRSVRGWSGFGSDKDTPLPFSADALERLMTRLWIRRPMVVAYLEAMAGGGPRRKNA